MIRTRSGNRYEERNRAAKVAAVVALLDEFARKQGFDPVLDAFSISVHLETKVTRREWDGIFVCAGQTKPSGDESIADVKAVYESRAMAVNDKGAA